MIEIKKDSLHLFDRAQNQVAISKDQVFILKVYKNNGLMWLGIIGALVGIGVLVFGLVLMIITGLLNAFAGNSESEGKGYILVGLLLGFLGLLMTFSTGPKVITNPFSEKYEYYEQIQYDQNNSKKDIINP